MTTVLDPATSRQTAPTPADPGAAGSAVATDRARWPLFGVAAGVTALAAVMVGMPSDLTEADYQAGPGVLDELERAGFHAAFLLGLVSIGCLLVAAAGWRRWAEQRAADDLAARTIPSALAAVATVNIIGVSLAGAMALYLPGGMDEGWLSREGQFANFNYLDFGLLFGWWGGVVAALCVAALAFGRRRVLPRWMGVVSVLFVLPPVGLAVVTALPGFPGLTMPLWLIVISLGMIFSRSAGAAAR